MTTIADAGPRRAKAGARTTSLDGRGPRWPRPLGLPDAYNQAGGPNASSLGRRSEGETAVGSYEGTQRQSCGAYAASCFACGRYNAAICHAIQAAEFWLRAVARDRRVIVKMNKKEVPLDQAMWGKIIEGLAPKVTLIDGWPSGKAKDAAHQFFKPSLLDADTLNDAYRRHISHGRSYSYPKGEAQFVIDVAKALSRSANSVLRGKRQANASKMDALAQSCPMNLRGRTPSPDHSIARHQQPSSTGGVRSRRQHVCPT